MRSIPDRFQDNTTEIKACTELWEITVSGTSGEYRKISVNHNISRREEQEEQNHLNFNQAQMLGSISSHTLNPRLIRSDTREQRRNLLPHKACSRRAQLQPWYPSRRAARNPALTQLHPHWVWLCSSDEHQTCAEQHFSLGFHCGFTICPKDEGTLLKDVLLPDCSDKRAPLCSAGAAVGIKFSEHSVVIIPTCWYQELLPCRDQGTADWWYHVFKDNPLHWVQN